MKVMLWMKLVCSGNHNLMVLLPTMMTTRHGELPGYNRQQEKGIDVTQQMIDEWVDTFAVHETALTRHNLKKNIFNVEVKDSFLTNYTRPQVVRFYSNCNLVILDGGAQVTTKIVDRLFEASQKVWLRDFLPTFFANAAKGIKTRLNFYVNTTNINTADEIELLNQQSIG